MSRSRKFVTKWGSVDDEAVYAMLPPEDRLTLESVSVEAADRSLERDYLSPRWRRVKAAMLRAMAAATDLATYEPPGVRR